MGGMFGGSSKADKMEDLARKQAEADRSKLAAEQDARAFDQKDKKNKEILAKQKKAGMRLGAGEEELGIMQKHVSKKLG